VAVLGWLINSIAPLVSALDWLKYLSPFYYAGHDPLANGVDITGVLVLCILSRELAVLGIAGLARRDLRA
jgi:beta-exotoxin I transport system permease protein